MLSFRDLSFDEKVLKALDELGFEHPTPVQEQAIPQLLTGHKDFIGLAQTGTGKTAAFGLPLISLLDFQSPITQALVLAPTRELCVQITNDIKNYSKYVPGINVVAVYGGASIDTQIRQIKKGAQIIVATPGRLIDLIGRRAIRLQEIKYIVLDEADEMLNMGFQEDIDEILGHTPEDKKVWLFSATMPREVRSIASNYMSDPFELTVGRKNESADNIEHYYYVMHERDRYAALKRILDGEPEIFGIVFCRTKLDTQHVAENLIRDGYNADALHGDLSQQQRDKVMARYRQRSLQVLIATDVAARGIDVNDITHVIHYNLPDESENYTHRSGRTARAGKSGVSIALLNIREIGKIHQIEKKINKKFHLGKIPSAVDVCEQQLLNLVKKIKSVEVDEKGISKYMTQVLLELEDLNREDLIQRIVSIEFNRFLEYYRNAVDLNVDLAHQGRSSASREGGSRSREPHLFINLGSVDGFDKFRMMDYVKEVANLTKAEIGRVDVKGVYSFVEVPQEKLPAVMESFKGEVFKGRPVRTELSGQEGKSSGGSGRSSYGSRSSSGPRRESSGPRRESSGPRRESSGPRRESSGTRSGSGSSGSRNKYAGRAAGSEEGDSPSREERSSGGGKSWGKKRF
jgi:ATP-dependent RNA helicase DeaD